MATPLRADLVDELLALVEKVYPGWKGFDDPRLVKDERSYKQEASVFARKLLGGGAIGRALDKEPLTRRELYGLLSKEVPDAIVEYIRRVAQKTNLLYRATPSTGDLAVLERGELTNEERADLFVDLLHGDGPVGERLDNYRARLESVGVAARWPLPTYLLFLLHPETEVFVKPSAIRWLLRTAGDPSYRAVVNSSTYGSIVDLHLSIGRELLQRSFKWRDMIDLQSFTWVAFLGARGQGQADEVEEDEANSGFEAEAETTSADTAKATHTDEQKEPASLPRRRGQANVPVHHDAPALVDELGRRPFAEILGTRIRESFECAVAAGGSAAFAVHLHGPWGSGKTSVLNFLEEDLRRNRSNWLVVRFDAWKHQRIRPPWWPLIQAVYGQAQGQLPWRARWWPRATRWGWGWRMSVLPVILTLATIALVGVLIYLFVSLASDYEESDVLALIATLIGLAGTSFTLHRSLLFGSAKAAQAHVELRSDPLDPFSKLFERLIQTFRRPVAIFVDDLDRCDADAVVDLLEGIQTLFRQAPVVYVVAADRQWIRSSFERRYESFVGNVGEPGRPLGHLFLEKMFQISVPVPRLSPEARREYWRRLIASTRTGAVEETERRLIEEGAELLADASSPEDIQQVVDRHKGAPVEAGVRIAAARKLSTPETIEETEHFLAGYSEFLEPNPRAMKRLVNAFGLQHAVNLLSRIDVPLEAVAAWTIVEQRWPELADLLAERPELLGALREGGEQKPAGVPRRLSSLFRQAEVRRIVVGEDGRGGLDSSSLVRLTGLGEEPAPPPAAASASAG